MNILVQEFERLRVFISKKDPFREHNMLDLDMEPTAYETYKKEWLEDKAFFKSRTSQDNYPGPNCLAGWANANHQALEQLPRPDRVNIVVWAAGTYQNMLVDLLLRADPSLLRIPDTGGDTLLHATVASQNSFLLRELFSQKRTVTYEDCKSFVPRLVFARKNDARWPVRFRSGDHHECIRIVGEVFPAALKEPLQDGVTALHLAASVQYPMGPCKAIVTAGGQWNRPDDNGRTPAHVLDANLYFRPREESKHPQERREARWKMAAMEAGNAPFEAPLITMAKSRFRNLFGRR